MVILGIDPGYATTGFGVVFSDRGNLKLLNYGTITTPMRLTFPQRLEVLYDDMEELLKTVKPEAVAVEELFWGHNVTTGIGVSHGRGVILLAIQKSGVPLYEYTPNQVKQAVVGYGAAAAAHGKGGKAGRRGGRHRHCALPCALVHVPFTSERLSRIGERQYVLLFERNTGPCGRESRGD